ncbi:MAG: hypothetical protein ACPG31_00395 [Planctomycetota bacterium]
MPLLLALALTLAPQDPSAESVNVASEASDPFGAVAMPELDRSEYRAWRRYLRPTDEEAAFEAIPWLPTFADGLKAAEEAQLPLLLWVMNGHPLGCT